MSAQRHAQIAPVGACSRRPRSVPSGLCDREWLPPAGLPRPATPQSSKPRCSTVTSSYGTSERSRSCVLEFGAVRTFYAFTGGSLRSPPAPAAGCERSQARVLARLGTLAPQGAPPPAAQPLIDRIRQTHRSGQVPARAAAPPGGRQAGLGSRDCAARSTCSHRARPGLRADPAGATDQTGRLGSGRTDPSRVRNAAENC